MPWLHSAVPDTVIIPELVGKLVKNTNDSSLEETSTTHGTSMSCANTSYTKPIRGETVKELFGYLPESILEAAVIVETENGIVSHQVRIVERTDTSDETISQLELRSHLPLILSVDTSLVILYAGSSSLLPP